VVLILKAKSDSVPGTHGRWSPRVSVIRQMPSQRFVTSPIRYHTLSVAGRCSGLPWGHLAKILLQQARTLITPIRLTFGSEDEQEDTRKDKGKGLAEEVNEDLKKPYKEVLKSPFTRRIIEFSAPTHRTPTNLKIYDGFIDPDDHITRFVGAANQGEWEMPVWCRMFQQTLDGPARGWFDQMTNGCIDGWADLREKFIERFTLRRKCSKDPTEVSKIV
ncbi:hypothetical protein Tco_1087526, partial [Tanacetum coccineum]